MKKNYGVWGLGVVGKSVLTFLRAHADQYELGELLVMDKRQPTSDEFHYLQEQNIQYINQNDQITFFERADYIIPSPGIEIHDTFAYNHKMVAELDLFFDAWKKPIIAVTGTLGKTSIVHLLSRILAHNGVDIATGGNIGTGMLDLVQQKAAYSLLELSSFQLDRAQRFAPDIAVLTNLYPNHLDRHKTMQDYLLAKYRIMHAQKKDQKALVPWTLKNQVRQLTQHPLHFFSAQPVSLQTMELDQNDTLYTFENRNVVKTTHIGSQAIYTLKDTQDLSYQENWLILLATCDILGILNQKTFSIPLLDLPQHRLEKIGIAHGITFYNDSKSTIPEATLAAVQHLLPARIHLFLGGLSKGVDRGSIIAAFKDKVASIICFGAEAEILYKACTDAAIPAHKYAGLEEAFRACIAQAQDNDTILFSPAGSSYDLFKDYKERGDTFNRLVHELINR